MLSSLDLNTAAERNLVQSFALQTVARLSPKDQCLPQVMKTVEMVKRGIGVHHGGLLPILKEMVEILFSRNLIKILFATETFAMGGEYTKCRCRLFLIHMTYPQYFLCVCSEHACEECRLQCHSETRRVSIQRTSAWRIYTNGRTSGQTWSRQGWNSHSMLLWRHSPTTDDTEKLQTRTTSWHT